jgi:hypothetical protein
MAQSVFFDSQIVTRVSDGIVPESFWKEVIERLAGKYEYCISFTTLMELVNALAGGDENHFQQNRNRLLIMTSPANAGFYRCRVNLSEIRSSVFRSILQSIHLNDYSKVGCRLSDEH